MRLGTYDGLPDDIVLAYVELYQAWGKTEKVKEYEANPPGSLWHHAPGEALSPYWPHTRGIERFRQMNSDFLLIYGATPPTPAWCPKGGRKLPWRSRCRSRISFLALFRWRWRPRRRHSQLCSPTRAN